MMPAGRLPVSLAALAWRSSSQPLRAQLGYLVASRPLRWWPWVARPLYTFGPLLTSSSMFHARTAYIDPGHGPDRQWSIILCGDPDVPEHSALDPVAFGAAGIAHNGELRPDFCPTCSGILRRLCAEACKRSNDF